MIEFRGVEKKAVEEQERVRLTAKQTSRIERTGQPELFPAVSIPVSPPSFEEEQGIQLTAARTQLRRLLAERARVRYEDALAALLEMPLVWDNHVRQIVLELRALGELDVKGIKPRKRTPKAGHVLVYRPRSNH